MSVLLLGGNGYIGSSFFKRTTHKVTSIDLCLFNANLGHSRNVNYNTLFYPNQSDLANMHDVIICLAGHSSVQMCENNPKNSWINNVTYFKTLCESLQPHQKLIYASSASVYGKTSGISTEESNINFNVLNHYDLQKITIDLIANKYIAEGKKIIGLRFGTVNGISPNLRADLVINSMVNTAKNTGKIIVKNSNIRRGILGINDLCKLLDVLVVEDVEFGQYNISSFNTSIKNIASNVADITNAEIIEDTTSDTIVYDFELDTTKIKNKLGFTFNDTIESLIEELASYMYLSNLDVRNNDRNLKLC